MVNADGVTAWKGTANTDASQNAIAIVPANALPEDDYEVVLRLVRSGGAAERAGSYYFSVRKP